MNKPIRTSLWRSAFVIAICSFIVACGGGPGSAASQGGKETTIYGPLSAEEKELLGPDADGNGVRDDVDAWIARKYPRPELIRHATTAAQWITWTMLRGYKGTATSLEEQTAFAHAVRCIRRAASDSIGQSAPGTSELISKILNTRIRTQYHLKWDSTLSGSVTRIAMNACPEVREVTSP